MRLTRLAVDDPAATPTAVVAAIDGHGLVLVRPSLLVQNHRVGNPRRVVRAVLLDVQEGGRKADSVEGAVAVVLVHVCLHWLLSSLLATVNDMPFARPAFGGVRKRSND